MEDTDRSEKLLAFLLIESMKGTMKEKAFKLSRAGFTNGEIADLLNTNASVIATLLSQARKGGTKKKTGSASK